MFGPQKYCKKSIKLLQKCDFWLNKNCISLVNITTMHIFGIVFLLYFLKMSDGSGFLISVSEISWFRTDINCRNRVRFSCHRRSRMQRGWKCIIEQRTKKTKKRATKGFLLARISYSARTLDFLMNNQIMWSVLKINLIICWRRWWYRTGVFRVIYF